jgi:hypothetical protein
MTEVEWLTCRDPAAMLEYLRGRPSDRKLRLFGVACCQRVWASIKGEPFREAVRVAELYADGLATQEEMEAARRTALLLFPPLSGGEQEGAAAAISAAGSRKGAYLLDASYIPWWEDEFNRGDPHAPAVVTARHAALAVACGAGQHALFGSAAEPAERREQAGIVRDIFGNPFKPVSISPAVLATQGGVVVRMATVIYEGRRWEDMPLLGDALEEAGVTDQAVLDHCRGPGPHARGCHVVDALLGRS